MKRVLIVDPSNFTPPYDQFLGQSLSDQGWHVDFVGRRPRNGEPSIKPPLEAHPIFYSFSERLRSRVPGRIFLVLKAAEHFFSSWRLVRLASRLKPRVIHVQWIVFPLVDRWIYKWLARRHPLVFTLHDSTLFQDAPTSSLQLYGYRRCLHLFDHVFVHTEQARKTLIEWGYPSSKITSVTHGPLPRRIRKVERGSTKTILLFGTLKNYKGADLLIEAFARLPERDRAGWKIVLAGRCDIDSDRLAELIARHGLSHSIETDFRFLPEPDLDWRLGEADIIAFPYRFVDASGAIHSTAGLEAAIIATSVGIFPEVVRDRMNGLLIPPNDVDALANALRSLMIDDRLRHDLARQWASTAEKSEIWATTALRTIDIYVSLRPASDRMARAP